MKSTSSSQAYGDERFGRRMANIGGSLSQLAPAGLPLLLILLFVFLAVLYATCTQYIRPDEFAVKQVDVPVPLLTGAAGIHTNIYQTGVHWLVPGCEKFLVFPKSIRAVTMTAKRGEGGESDEFVRYEGAAHIQTSDGFSSTSTSNPYRVVDPTASCASSGRALYEQNGIVFQVSPH